jgi:diphosphomevalonate decarboxylase
VSSDGKQVGSSEGHRLAASSPLQAARLAGAEGRLQACRRALFERDFSALAQVVEEDSDLMHAVMESSTPPLRYRVPASYELMAAIRQWRDGGQAACYTLDAGPNVHCLCLSSQAASLEAKLLQQPGVLHVFPASPGSAARRLREDDPLSALL